MESFLKNNFFQNPFGGDINSMGSGNGLLERIQQQVTDNGAALQSLQGGIGGGIGGLPGGGNLPPGGIGGSDEMPIFTPDPNPIAPPNIFNPPQAVEPPSAGNPTPGVPGYPGAPPDFGKIDMFGPINVDELNKRHPGIEQGFFASDEYNKFHYDPGNLMGTSNAVFSKYFGGQGSGSVSSAQDAAYEAYLKRIGKSDLIGKNVSGLPNGIFNEEVLVGYDDPVIGRRFPKDEFISAPMDPLFGRAFAGKPI